MNILASYDWLNDFLKKPTEIGEFVRRMTEVGNSVEQVIDVASGFEKMVVGKILEVKAHPNADKLRVVVIDIGKKVEIVCGGSNLEVDHLVAVALPGSKVKWHGQGDLVEIQETELRGVKSFGMICAPSEIGFEKLSGGEKEIWDVTTITDAKPGTPLAEALGLNDQLFDIEVTTNRPDAMSIVGLAREAGAAGLGKFESVDHGFSRGKASAKAKALDYPVSVEAPDLCPRYQAVVIENVKVKPSPWWLQKRLLLSGHHPINNVVDVTNYILHELGQPLHAFDADKLEGGKIIVRQAKKGEKILALDGKEYALDSSMLAICDANGPVAVAGVMGGEPTGTTESTTRLVIEAATFDPVSIRRTARALNLYSDSSSLFEKGLSTESTTPALARAIELIVELTGGHVASEIADERASEYVARSFPFDSERVNALIGVTIPKAEQEETLEHLGFVFFKDHTSVVVPYWRDHDIEASVDFVEEIARMHGYGNLPSILPTGALPTPIVEPIVIWERRLKNILKEAGATELYSNAFLAAEALTKLDIALDQTVHLLNPLSEEIAYMRPLLLPSLLTAVEQNQHRFDRAELFEINAVHVAQKNDLPRFEQQLLIAAYDADGAVAFARTKGLLERTLREAGIVRVRFEAGTKDGHLHPGRSASVFVDDLMVGTIGELAPLYASRFGIDKRITVAQILLDTLLPLLGTSKAYEPVSVFPDTVRDISFVIQERLTYDQIFAGIVSANALIKELSLLDVYQGKGIDPGKKSMAFRLYLRAMDRTLSSEEADEVMKSVARVIENDFGGIIR